MDGRRFKEEGKVKEMEGERKTDGEIEEELKETEAYATTTSTSLT